MDRETEMMICMKEQGYSYYSEDSKKCIGFSIEVMMDMWDILLEEYSQNKTKENK